MTVTTGLVELVVLVEVVGLVEVVVLLVETDCAETALEMLSFCTVRIDARARNR